MTGSTRSTAIRALLLVCVVTTPGAVATVGAGAFAPDAGQATVAVTTETTDGTVAVDVRITNTGDASARYTVELVAETRGLVTERDFRVPRNGTRQAVFETDASGTVTHAVYVNDVQVDEFTVTTTETPTETDGRQVPGPIVVGLAGASLILVAGSVLFRLT